MTKIDIVSGFLGAGKTTLIKKLLQEAYAGEKVVLIENEFGEIGIDGGFLQESGITVNEMNSGCICCSLVGDFSKALQQVSAQYAPDRIVIEPSGVGKLSDVIKAVSAACLKNARLNAFCCVVDAGKCKAYMKNFGEFFSDQVEHANCIILSHTANISAEKLAAAVQLLKEKNATATLVAAQWDTLDGKTVLTAMEGKDTLQTALDGLAAEVKRVHHEHHEHHHHEHGEECEDEHCCCHEHHHHHHHEHGEECEDEHCCCHEHHEHHHHHHHHADEVFTSWGIETTKAYAKAELLCILKALEDEEKYGKVLRAKGIVAGGDTWLHFDYVPNEADVREGGAAVIGRLCVIGCGLNKKAIEALFQA